jgi:G:T-mismatch repair DNA endonuclease (very short patch repair protein)
MNNNQYRIGKNYDELYGINKSKKIKKKMSEAKKGKQNLLKGIKRSEEFKNKMKIVMNKPEIKFKCGLSMKGKHWKEDSKIKMINKLKLLKYPEELYPNKGMRGKKHKKETIEKISLALKKSNKNFGWKKGNIPWNKGLKGYIHSEETKRKISLSNKGNPKLIKSRAERILPLKDTTIEVKIQNFLKQLGITFFTHQYIKEIEHKYQCDILIPSMNLVIECDGDYWHNYPIGRNIDKIRTSKLIEKGFKVLHLWECDIKIMNINQFKEKLNMEGEI